jgi:HAD superfamily hydrolase (TIGR01549 family)
VGEIIKKLQEKVKGKKIIIWDFDGTIADLGVDWEAMRAELVSNISPGKSGLRINELVSEYIQQGKKSLAFSIIKKYESAAKASINPEVKEFILKNKDKFKMAVFSDNLRETIEQGLSSEKMTPAINILVSKEDVAEFKPSIDGLIQISAYFKERNKKAYLFIGDRDSDGECASAFGIDFFKIDKKVN